MVYSDSKLQAAIAYALAEDVGLAGDITSQAVVAEDLRLEHVCRVKQNGVIAGLTIAAMVFSQVDSSVQFEPLVQDGSQVMTGTEIAVIRGPARAVLTGERTALNYMQRMSGIATLTSQYVEKTRDTKACILDTRKTAPGLRYFDKAAVKLGGGTNHRMGLYDMIMIKDNHIAAAGSIAAAVKQAKISRPEGVEIEVEAATIDQLREALDAGVDRILLDNMSLIELREAVAITNGTVPLEASGNVTLNTVAEIAATGVDYISVGALTHSVMALDIHLETLSLKPKGRN